MNTKASTSFLRIFLCLLMLLLAAGTAAWAQAGRGSISGTITDPTGALVPAPK